MSDGQEQVERYHLTTPPVELGGRLGGDADA